MNKLFKTIFTAFVITMVTYGSGIAVPTIGYIEGWGTDNNTEGWGADPLNNNIISVTHDNAGDFLKLVVTGAGAIPGVGGAITSTSPAFTGNFSASGALAIQFQLLTFGNTPGELQLYFGNTGSTHIWAYDLLALSGAPVANGVTTYSANLGSAGWIAQNGGWTIGDLANDWGQVEWFGVYLQGSAGPAETYGIDNMQFTVPEPETVWMIMMVLASLALTFRGRLVGIAAQVKARINA